MYLYTGIEWENARSLTRYRLLCILCRTRGWQEFIMEKGVRKKFIQVRNHCGEDFNKGSKNIYYCGLNKRIDESCIAADVLGRYVFAKCCAKNCPKIKQ